MKSKVGMTVGILLILAWKNAGHIGLDRWLLPVLGTPWKQTELSARQPGQHAVPLRN